MELRETRCLQTRDGRRFIARRLMPGDEAALQRFNDSLLPCSERWFRAHGYDDDTVRRVLARSAAGDDLTVGLFDADRLVGYFFLWYFSNPVPLLGIGLLDPYHGCGLGRQMMVLLIAEARTAGKDGIALCTDRDNDRAFALYSAMGFEYYRDVPSLQGDGTTVIEKAMFHRLKPGARPGNVQYRPPV